MKCSLCNGTGVIINQIFMDDRYDEPMECPKCNMRIVIEPADEGGYTCFVEGYALIGRGNTPEEALADFQSSARFHGETFGETRTAPDTFPTGQYLADVLQTCGLIDAAAVDDPEGFDNYRTLGAVNAAAKCLREGRNDTANDQADRPERVVRHRRTDKTVWQK